MADIDSFEALQVLERRIGNRLAAYPIDSLLWGLRQHAEQVPPVVAAGIALFAIRFCRAPEDQTVPLSWDRLARITEQVHRYVLTDPIVFDEDLRETFNQSNPAFLFLRLLANQLPFQVNEFVSFARSLLLFDEIPRDLARRVSAGKSDFDLGSAFERVCGVSVADFVRVGSVLAGLASRRVGFDVSALVEGRRQGLRLPSHDTVLQVIDHFTATPQRLREIYESHRVPDRRFAMYDLNPLHVCPIVRPWGNDSVNSEYGGRMIAPMPDLVTSRFSIGIYYHMLREYGTEFTQFFGRVFEEYCGRLLRAAVPAGTVVSESEIRLTYPMKRGSVPDFVIVEGGTAILLECKATRFSLAAQTIADVDSVNASLEQALKGLGQLYRFAQAILSGAPGLEAFGSCTQVLPVLLTLEPLYVINSEFLREHVDALLGARGVTGLPWRVVSMEELESVQPHVAAGVPLSEALGRAPTHTVMADYEARTGRKNVDSYLNQWAEKLFGSLGVDKRALNLSRSSRSEKSK